MILIIHKSLKVIRFGQGELVIIVILQKTVT